MKWIKASERLPEVGKTVIVRWYKHGEFLRIEATDEHQLKFWIETDGIDHDYEWLDESAPNTTITVASVCAFAHGGRLDIVETPDFKAGAEHAIKLFNSL